MLKENIIGIIILINVNNKKQPPSYQCEHMYDIILIIERGCFL
jgi:hypothetical protein